MLSISPFVDQEHEETFPAPEGLSAGEGAGRAPGAPDGPAGQLCGLPGGDWREGGGQS